MNMDEKNEEMINKAIDKVGVDKDDIMDAYYPVSRFDIDGRRVCEFKEEAVGIVLNVPEHMGSSAVLLVFGLEEK
jgi:signal recognition particle subunit SEC65